MSYHEVPVLALTGIYAGEIISCDPAAAAAMIAADQAIGLDGRVVNMPAAAGRTNAAYPAVTFEVLNGQRVTSQPAPTSAQPGGTGTGTGTGPEPALALAEPNPLSPPPALLPAHRDRSQAARPQISTPSTP